MGRIITSERCVELANYIRKVAGDIYSTDDAPNDKAIEELEMYATDLEFVADSVIELEKKVENLTDDAAELQFRLEKQTENFTDELGELQHQLDVVRDQLK